VKLKTNLINSQRGSGRHFLDSVSMESRELTAFLTVCEYVPLIQRYSLQFARVRRLSTILDSVFTLYCRWIRISSILEKMFDIYALVREIKVLSILIVYKIKIYPMHSSRRKFLVYCIQGVTKRGRLSLMTNSGFVQMRGGSCGGQ
jgi:hypothetical protein